MKPSEVDAMIRNLHSRLELVEAKFDHPALAEMLKPRLLKAPEAGRGDATPRGRPADETHYRPLESPRMYPLELDDRLHICLWDERGESKWSIACWARDREGYDLKFVGDRPLDARVDWRDFRAVIRQGQAIADARFEEEEKAT